MKKTPIIILTILILLASHAIKAQGYASFTPIEKSFLKIILSDTISNTISYLPDGFTFNMSDVPYGHLILLKSGKKNLFLRDGNHHVYDIDTSGKGPKLRRIDSSRYSGHNFRCMGFMRNDTLFQHGGYGFWRTIDFFTYYDERKHDWSFFPAVNTLANELSYHYYDRQKDIFYTIGSHYRNEQNNNNSQIIDSVYRYDFSERKWTSIGKVIPENQYLLKFIWNKYDPMVHSSFGLIDFSYRYPRLIDIENNRIYQAREKIFDDWRSIKNQSEPYKSSYHVNIHLNDTLHVFFGSASVHVVKKMRMTRQDFETTKWSTIYNPTKTENGHWSQLNSIGAVSLFLFLSTLITLFFLRSRKRRQRESANALPQEHDQSGMVAKNDIIKSTTGDFSQYNGDPKPPVERFLTALSTGERELVRKLLTMSMQGGKIDIATMNKVLGVGKKDESVQKTRRSIAVSNINNAFSLTMKTPGQLINRERDAEDKRSYQYFMAEEFFSILSGQIDI